MYGEFVSRFRRGAIREIAAAHGLTYGAAQKRLVAAGVHVGVKRRPRAPGSGVCACGSPAKSGRYRGKGDPLCFRCYMRAYASDPESPVRRKAREYIAELKRNAVCADCNGKFPTCVYHFDHVPGRGPKLFNIAGCDVSIARLKAEVAKCDIVCANCHAIRTWVSRGDPLDDAA